MIFCLDVEDSSSQILSLVL